VPPESSFYTFSIADYEGSGTSGNETWIYINKSNNTVVNPSNTRGASGRLIFINSNDQKYSIHFMDLGGSNSSGYYIEYLYSDRNATISGNRNWTETYINSSYPEYNYAKDVIESYNISLVKGWNILYDYQNLNMNNENYSITNATPSGVTGMKWVVMF